MSRSPLTGRTGCCHCSPFLYLFPRKTTCTTAAGGGTSVFRGERKETHKPTTTISSCLHLCGSLTHTLTGPLTMTGWWKIKAVRDHFIHSAVLNKEDLSQIKIDESTFLTLFRAKNYCCLSLYRALKINSSTDDYSTY